MKKIIEKPKNLEISNKLVNIGVYKLTHHIFKEKIVIGSNGEHLLPPMIGNLAQKMDIFVEKADFWIPIAYPEDIKKAEKILINKGLF